MVIILSSLIVHMHRKLFGQLQVSDAHWIYNCIHQLELFFAFSVFQEELRSTDFILLAHFSADFPEM